MSNRGVILAGSHSSNLSTALTSVMIGTSRNNFDGYVGFQFFIGARSLKLISMGRWIVAGNNQSHVITIRDVSGVPIANATIDASGKPVDGFTYSNASSQITLTSGGTYYIMSQEFANFDFWGDQNTVTPSIDLSGFPAAVAACFSSASSGVPSLGTANMSFVPVNFKYLLI